MASHMSEMCQRVSLVVWYSVLCNTTRGPWVISKILYLPEDVTIKRVRGKYEIFVNGQHSPEFDFLDRETDRITQIKSDSYCTNGVATGTWATGTGVCNDAPKGGYTHTLIYPPGTVPQDSAGSTNPLCPPLTEDDCRKAAGVLGLEAGGAKYESAFLGWKQADSVFG